ncbi:DEAD/DEAH box helicase [Lentilactobacillus kosonis]|uniref:ATP-dependent RNA helicase YfmL n=1 Tax=Lentilactobacillus kosonis TaxID=2810561 RepID=A0A401FLC1_9LACO|nr:DEAD/DEAH box helicase [Lentilactobacillus kosonis]GAY73182.1 ATP-dependent RNA helicase YfmL [Lentilactobacillus kosonis]
MLVEFEQLKKRLGFTEVTAIQREVYKPLLDGRSVVGISPTGSGKTVAFMEPLLERIESVDGEISMLILEPSAELAMQVFRVVSDWAKEIGLTAMSAIGGANISRQIDKLKEHPEIVVGTVGRISELIDKGKLNLHELDSIVIDEADNLLSEETLDPIRDMADMAPDDVTLGLFSATRNNVIDNINQWFNQNIELIDVTDIDDSKGKMTHGFLMVSNIKKPLMLARLLAIPNFKALVFFDKVTTLQKTYSNLTHRNIREVGRLTSEQTKLARKNALRDFRKGKIRLLMVTDVAARGIDIDNLPAVINYELPRDDKTYTHRSGRTARMHQEGLVLSLGDDHDFRDFKKLLGDKTELTQLYFDENKLVDKRPAADKKPAQRGKDTKQLKNTESKSTEPGLKSGKPVVKSDKTVTSQPKSSKKKKNKHSKRKGMRHQRQSNN